MYVKKQLEKRNCLNCGKEFLAKRADKKSCSKICNFALYRKEHREEINRKMRDRLLNNTIEERQKRAESARKWRLNNPDKSRALHRNRKDRLNGPTGEMPTPDQIQFYGYKEPLRKFEGGHGYQGVLIYSKDKEKVQCHFCGRMFRAINNGHLQKVHGLTASKYKEQTGLSPTASLVGEKTREKLLKRPFNPNHMDELKKARDLRTERKLKGLPDLQSGRKLSLEVKNKRGTCPDQLLDIIDKTVKSYGRVMTQEEFLKFHHGKYVGSIRHTFGTWTNALAKLNLKTNVAVDEGELLRGVKNFYEVHKRTPRWSDFNRGLVSEYSCSVIYHRYRGLNHLRLVAGVPLIIPVGRRREEWLPNGVERERMMLNYNR